MAKCATTIFQHLKEKTNTQKPEGPKDPNRPKSPKTLTLIGPSRPSRPRRPRSPATPATPALRPRGSPECRGLLTAPPCSHRGTNRCPSTVAWLQGHGGLLGASGSPVTSGSNRAATNRNLHRADLHPPNQNYPNQVLPITSRP